MLEKEKKADPCQKKDEKPLPSNQNVLSFRSAPQIYLKPLFSENLAKGVVAGNLPFSIVCNPGFLYILNSLGVEMNDVPSRWTVSRSVDKVLDESLERIVNEIDSNRIQNSKA